MKKKSFVPLAAVLSVGCLMEAWLLPCIATDGCVDKGYRASIEEQIISSKPSLSPDGYGKLTKIAFSVFKNGSVKNLRVTSKSGSPENDARALRSVISCAPFKPIPIEYAPKQDFEYEINANAHLLSSRCEPPGLEDPVDEFLNHLAHRWHPPRSVTPRLVTITFGVATNGKITGATLSSSSYSKDWAEDFFNIIFEHWTLFQMASAVAGQSMPPDTGLDEIRVDFSYNPDPLKPSFTCPGLIGTGCGPGPPPAFASGSITFFDPH
jgi:hypothetical protein